MGDLIENIIKCSDDFVVHYSKTRKFDYSEISIGWVEELLEAAFNANISPKEIDSLIDCAGSYILEVARRNYGGKYYWDKEMDQPVLVTGEPDFKIALLAVEKVRLRLQNGREDGISFFFYSYTEHVKLAKPGEHFLLY